MTKQFVNQLTDKQSLHSVFLIKEMFLLKGKNGKAYISLSLSDRSGAVDARIWDNVDEVSQSFQTGDFVRVKGVVQLFQNRKQVVVHKVEKAQEGEYELRDFMQVSAQDPGQMFAELLALIHTVQDPFIRQLILNVVENPDVKPKILQAPAAKSIHHAYWGGLLEHVLSICKIMTFMADHYTMLNRDLLYFGAIFHDIGKLWELEYETGTSYSDEGRMIGHLVMAVELIEKESTRIEGFPDELKMLLKHIVLSHHGKLEYGSPKTPSFLEAFVVAFIDDLDSKMNTIHTYMENERQSGEKWSRFHQMFERYFFLGVSRDKAYGNVAKKPAPSEAWSEPAEAMSLVIPANHAGLSYKNENS